MAKGNNINNLLDFAKKIANNVDTKAIVNIGKKAIESIDQINTITPEIQKILQEFTPVKINIKDSINKKSVVINEDEIKKYLVKKLKDTKEIENLEIKILDDNIINVSFDTKTFFAKVPVNQKMKIEEFKINKKEGIVKIKLISDSDFNTKIMVTLVRFLLSNVLKSSLVNEIDEKKIIVDDNGLITIDLKETFLKDDYEKNIIDIIKAKKDNVSGYLKKFLNEDITGMALDTVVNIGGKMLDNKKLVDFFEINGLKTEKGKVIIDFSVNVSGIF